MYDVYSMKEDYDVSLEIIMNSILTCKNKPILLYLCPYPKGFYGNSFRISICPEIHAHFLSICTF